MKGQNRDRRLEAVKPVTRRQEAELLAQAITARAWQIGLAAGEQAGMSQISQAGRIEIRKEDQKS